MFLVEKEIHSRMPPPETDEREGWDRFGFLPSAVSVSCEGAAIEPVTNYDDVMKWVQDHITHDNLVASPSSADRFEPGVIFPPVAWRQQHDPMTDDLVRVVSGSEGLPLLHHVPVSHYVQIDGVGDMVAEREKAAGLVTKLVGFIHDAPTQFHDWWFDGPTSIGAKNLHPTPAVLADFVSHSLAVWRHWQPGTQELLISALWMHGRAAGQQWYWERFAWEYTVTDACYNIIEAAWPGRLLKRWKAVRTKGAPGKPPHGTRIELMCAELGLRLGSDEQKWVEFAVDLRNRLIHEARWCGSQPSTKSSSEAALAPRILHKLNQRLIVGLLGYRNTFVASGWHTFTNAGFDLMK